MPIDCIIRTKADDLKQAFREKKITMEMLHNATSAKRVSLLGKYIGNSSKMAVARLEKAFLVPRQKMALRRATYNMFGITPLYDGLSIEESTAMAKGINIRSMRKMSTTERQELLSKYVNPKMAKTLNEFYSDLEVSGNLKLWEKRAFGTEKLREDKRLKGAISKIEALDDLGALNPEDTEKFMETLVEDQLGVNLTVEESQKLSKLTDLQRDAFDLMMDKTDGSLTYENEDVITDYLVKVQAVQDYAQTLNPVTVPGIFNMVFDTMRAFILASPRILKNSMIYQGIPGIERAIVKRIVSGNMSDADLKSTVMEKMQAKLSGIKPSKESAEFIKKQTAFAMRLYHKTGYDLSRMNNLDEGQVFFGEKVARAVAKPFGESEGILEKTASIVAKMSRMASLAPKWLAGGTDTLFANMSRADTSTMLSREKASLETKKGILPQGMTEAQRADQLLRESYTFNPKDKKAVMIRDAGIRDAHYMNNTQPDAFASKVGEIRGLFNFGKLQFGTVVVPFAKIAATTISEGIQTATGIGIVKSIWQINNAVQEKNIDDRSAKMHEGVNKLIRYLGFTGAVLFFASLFDDDDFIPPYAFQTPKEGALARARGGHAGMIRIAGKWIPLRYFPIVNIPLASILTARQHKAKGNKAIIGYLAGFSAQILEAPGIKELGEVLKKFANLSSSKELSEAIDSLGFESNDIKQWLKVRIMPSVISYDLYNAVVPKDARYDFLGRDIESTGFLGFKDDKTNDILLEFNRLNQSNNMPAVSTPKGDHPSEEVAMFQREYADQVRILMGNWEYSALDDAGKKKEIDKIRSETVLKPLKELEELNK